MITKKEILAQIAELEMKVDRILDYVDTDNSAAERHMAQMVDKYKNKIITANQLEYLKDRNDKLSADNETFKQGAKELQQTLNIILMQLAMKYGGENHELVMEKQDLTGWKPSVTRIDDGTMIVRLEKE